jgi:chromosome segregation ATPase
MPDPNSPQESLLNLSEPKDADRLDDEVQRAQEQLLSLKRQQEQIERQKRELEELSRKQTELDAGRADLMEKLTRGIVVIDRETQETQRRYEQLVNTRESFQKHLAVLDVINPKAWDKSALPRELSKALTELDEARVEYERGRSRINAEAPADPVDAGQDIGAEFDAAGQGFAYWFKAGLAFTLPLTLAALLIFIGLLLLATAR